MPQKNFKPCKFPGCPGLTREKYCAAHADLEEADKRAAAKFYDTAVRDREMRRFYQSPAWQRLRIMQLQRQPLCEMCLAENRFEKAEVVDHITEIRTENGAPLDIYNLQSLCKAHHNQKTAKAKAARNDTDNYSKH